MPTLDAEVISGVEGYLGFGIRYFSIPESEFHAGEYPSDSVVCHVTRSKDAQPLVILNAQAGSRPTDIRSLAMKLLLIADDAEALCRDPNFQRCFRRY